jgi:hypothetical protein
MAVQAFTKVQYGLEAVNGTAVAADTILLCTFDVPANDREVHIPQADVGLRTAMLDEYAIVRRAHAAGGTLADADGAYFQAFPLLLSACLNGNVTAVEQNTGEGDYLWTFTAPTTGAEDLDTFTIEKFDDSDCAEIAYCLIPELTISGDCISGEVHFSATVDGDEVIHTTGTGALSLPTAELMTARLSRFYADTTWAGLGGSEIANSLINWEVTISGGAHHKFHGGTVRHPSGHNQGYITASASLTFERTAAVETESDFYRAGADTYTQTQRFIRIETLGTQIGAGDVQNLSIDLAGLWTEWGSQGAVEDGNSLDTATFTMGYDSTGTQGLRVLVTTDISTI